MQKVDKLYKDDIYEEDELELMDLIFTIIRRWKLIVFIGVPLFIVGALFAMSRPTIYRAEMTMIVSNGRSYSASSLDGSELSVNQKLATTYAEIAKSKVILTNVIRKYDLDITLKNLQRQVRISPVEDTELLQLTYENSDPGLAAAIVNEIGNEFIIKVREIMNFQNIKIVEMADTPKEALPKKRGLILGLSFVASITIGCMMAFVVEVFFCKLRKQKEIEKILEVSMLGMVPDFTFSSGEVNKNEK